MLKSVEQPCDSRVISISIQDKSLEISFLCFKSYHCRTSKSRADVPFVILLFSMDWNLSRELVYFPWDSVHPFPILTPSQALILDKWDLFLNVRIMGSLSMHTESGCPGGALRGRARWEESPKKSIRAARDTEGCLGEVGPWRFGVESSPRKEDRYQVGLQRHHLRKT